jgi:hypothetical protein
LSADTKFFVIARPEWDSFEQFAIYPDFGIDYRWRRVPKIKEVIRNTTAG